ncbi:hypothetical protein Q0M94_08070 [Deinococcus radiomollis]|uniref:hypothetical protein n=1 Tax=Deinococcus radiomollis TaxID=468916 RepID=UPI003891F985
MHKAVKMFKRDGLLPVLTSVTVRIRSEVLRQQYGYPSGLLVEQGTVWLTGPYASVGRNLRVGRRCRIETVSIHNGIAYEPHLKIGNRVSINDDVHIGCALSIMIGDDVLMAGKIFISDHNHGRYSGNTQDSARSLPSHRALGLAPVVIGNRVWLGEMVSVLPGVTIGEGSIIGSNSVVSRDVPPMTIAVGSPARPVKSFDVRSGTWKRINKFEDKE